MTTDTAQIVGGEPQAAPVAPPRVRMDKSRAFNTIHGERGPGDPLSGVMYRQDGIPCDAQGYFIFDHPDLQKPGPEGDKLRRLAMRKIERQLKIDAKKPPPPVHAESDDDDEDVDAKDGADKDELLEPINLEAWLRGEQQVEWQEVTQEIARRYKKRISKMEDAVAFLVKEGVVAKAQLKKQFQKFAD